jgi:hypothetical protein
VHIQDMVSWTICQDWLRTVILLISASWVARRHVAGSLKYCNEHAISPKQPPSFLELDGKFNSWDFELPFREAEASLPSGAFIFRAANFQYQGFASQVYLCAILLSFSGKMAHTECNPLMSVFQQNFLHGHWNLNFI